MFTFQKKYSIQVGEIVFHCHQLSARNLRAAREAVADKQIRDWQQVGPDVLRVLRERNAAAAPPPAKDEKKGEVPDLKARTEARYAEYDPFSVVRLGLDGWSLNDPINEKTIDQVVDALLEEQLDKLHKGILDESLPPLDPGVQQVAEGKDSAPSTST